MSRKMCVTEIRVQIIRTGKKDVEGSQPITIYLGAYSGQIRPREREIMSPLNPPFEWGKQYGDYSSIRTLSYKEAFVPLLSMLHTRMTTGEAAPCLTRLLTVLVCWKPSFSPFVTDRSTS
jgi:hypothetical protein